MTLSSGRYAQAVRQHYSSVWGERMSLADFPPSTRSFLSRHFEVLCLPPTSSRNAWTYATSGMSEGMQHPIELHILSPNSSDEVPELLAAVASFHREIGGLALGDTVNFGKPWIQESTCEYGLVSLPYLDGPSLEILDLGEKEDIRFYWLLPITQSEVEFKKENGLDELEALFDATEFNYLDPFRSSVA